MRIRLRPGRAGVATLLVAVFLAPSPARPGESIETAPRIDLLDPDPAEVARLPGILPQEIEAILSIAGPGPGDLKERLDRTGIPRERLLQWLPCFDLPDESAGGRGSARLSLLRPAGSRARIASRTVVAAGRVRAEIASEGSGGRSSRLTHAAIEMAADPLAIARGVRPPWRARAGTVRLGVRGGDPWADPLASASPRVLCAPSGVFREDRAVAGAAFSLPGLLAGLWREEGEGGGTPGFLLLRERGRGTVLWAGMRPGRGAGGGIGFAPAGLHVSARLERPSGCPPIASFCFQDRQQRIDAGAALSLGRRRDGAAARADLRLDRSLAGLRARLAATVLSGSRRAAARLTGSVLPARSGWLDARATIGSSYTSVSLALAAPWRRLPVPGALRIAARAGEDASSRSFGWEVGWRGVRRQGDLRLLLRQDFTRSRSHRIGATGDDQSGDDPATRLEIDFNAGRRPVAGSLRLIQRIAPGTRRGLRPGATEIRLALRLDDTERRAVALTAQRGGP
ncbi:MAG: hypothetical protein ACE15D_01645 [Candidatus Eisenbacteria bacterium]